MEFKKGDIVILKSGGPQMTIDNIGDYAGINQAKCIWFEKENNKEALFNLESLVKYEYNEDDVI